MREVVRGEPGSAIGNDLAYGRAVGTVLRAKYHLDRVLGVGGMAVVYAATHRNQKRVAIKILHAELSLREDVRARFLREGYAANTVDHPGAVAVLDDDVTDEGAAFLVMELLEGESLEHLWEKSGRKLPAEAILALGHQLLDVLAAAHAKSIVHRDIKPANLFLTREGQLKVLDFGIARVRDAAASIAEATGSGLVLGTPAFMSPEQALARAQEIDARTDVWAAGATLFSLLAGRHVHEGENSQQVLIRAATTPAPSLGSIAPEAPRSIVELVDRALAFDKGERWPSAEAMRDAIRDAHLSVCGRILSRDSLLPLVEGVDRHRLPTELALSPSAASLEQSVSQSRRPSAPVAATVDDASANRPIGLGASSGTEVPVPPTVSATESQSPGVVPKTVPDPTSARTEVPNTVRRTAPMPLVGGTTSRPVARDGDSRPAVGRDGRQSRTPWVGFGVMGVVACAFGVWALTGTSRDDSPSSAAVGAPLPTGPATPRATASGTTTATPPPLAASEAPSTDASPRAFASSAPSPSVPAPAPPRPFRTSPSPTAPQRAAPPDCDPPFTFDSQHRKIFKTECL